MLKRTSGYLVTWLNLLPPIATLHIIALIMLGVFQDAWSYRLPEYIDTPSNVTYYRGDRAILQCAVKYLGTKQVVIWWKKNDDYPLTYGELIYVSDKDFSIDHIPHRDEWNLVISNVQLKHAGEYECQISTTEDLRKYVQLNVIDEPAPPREAIKITGKKYVDKGEKIVLTCNASGELFPPEDIDWFKDGRKIKQNQIRGISIAKFRIAETKTLHSQLEIDKADMTDNGIYICRSSDLAITSKSVMVLNGKSEEQKVKPRSQDDDNINTDSSYIAETNHKKRENPNKSDASASTSAACAMAFVMRGDMCTTLLTMLCFFFVAIRVCNRTF